MLFINYRKIDSSHYFGRTKAPVTSETVVNTCDLLLAPMTQFYPDLNSGWTLAGQEEPLALSCSLSFGILGKKEVT